MAILGIECSTFVPVNKGTSKRDELNPWGNVLAPSVLAANMASSRQAAASYATHAFDRHVAHADGCCIVVYCRCMLLLVLLVCLGHNFFVENPANTIIGLYPRFQWVFKVLKGLGVPAPCHNHVVMRMLPFVLKLLGIAS